jgi:hypothetical protein
VVSPAKATKKSLKCKHMSRTERMARCKEEV